eukprot:2223036-Rhodomonas_salina.2
MPSDASVARHENRLRIHWDAHQHQIVLSDIQLLVLDSNGDATGIGPGRWPGADAQVAVWHRAVWYLGLGVTMTKGAHQG